MSGATIPYQLRPHKGIERNLFIDLLNVLDGANLINIRNYRYVGFGAASLEDFKAFHYELGITDMHSIEKDKFAISRQRFNNPFHFLTPFPKTSTDYITTDFQIGDSQIIWLDYVNNQLRQQLYDIEFAAAKLINLDILKLTFNVHTSNFITANGIPDIAHPDKICSETDFKSIIKFFKDDPTYQFYFPNSITVKDVINLSAVIRAMAVRAINRGLAKNDNKNLRFNHIVSFDYADGQKMTTMTGVISTKEDFNKLLRQSKLKKWQFYQKLKVKKEQLLATEITVPDMTIIERFAIDKQLPSTDIKTMAKSLTFLYGTESRHLKLIEGYNTFYKYLPYYGKVIY
jgi:hypothetical protein